MGLTMHKNKEKHMLSCARFMYDNAPDYGLNPEEMYVLGFLHDIGYVYTKKNHAIAGKKLMQDLGYKHAEFIKFHEFTPERYIKETGNKDIPRELVLLWEADMSVDYLGRRSGFEGRSADIKKRYGEHSHAYQECLKTIEFIKKYKKELKNNA